MARPQRIKKDSNAEDGFMYEIDKFLNKSPESRKQIWQSFKRYYKSKNKSEVLDAYDTIEDFLDFYLGHDDKIFDQYIVFTMKQLILKIMTNLHEVADSLHNAQDAELDYKTSFVIFDKMVGQVTALVNLYDKVINKIGKNQDDDDGDRIFDIENIK